jgi:hypothetical protein
VNVDSNPSTDIYEALALSGAAVAVVRGPELRVEYLNPAHRRLFGWSTGARLDQLGASGVALAEPVAAVIAGGEATRIDDVPTSGVRLATVLCSPTGSGALLVAVETTDQARARRRAEDRSERLAVLDQATTALTTDLDPHRELVSLAQTVVPTVADACAVYLIDQTPRRDGEPVRATRLAAVIEPGLGVRPPAPEIRLNLPPNRAAAQAAVTGEATLLTEAELRIENWGERWLRDLAPHSVIAIPLGQPEPVAVVKFVAVRPRPPFRPDDLALMREIAARADTAFGHARRLHRATNLALTLQRDLLSDPVTVDWLEVAVRYRPAEPELEACGDWYDTFSLDGGVGLVIGDVVGHDIDAISTMGQLRSMLRALAHQPGADPGSVITALNRLSVNLDVGRFATLAYASLHPEPAGASLTYARAGHPPPLVLQPDGTVELLDHPDSPLLGLAPHTYKATQVQLPDNARLLFYTDGLLEDPVARRENPLGDLLATVRDHPWLDPEEMTDRLIAEAPTADDVAMLAVRIRD